MKQFWIIESRADPFVGVVLNSEKEARSWIRWAKNRWPPYSLENFSIQKRNRIPKGYVLSRETFRYGRNGHMRYLEKKKTKSEKAYHLQSTAGKYYRFQRED